METKPTLLGSETCRRNKLLCKVKTKVENFLGLIISGIDFVRLVFLVLSILHVLFEKRNTRWNLPNTEMNNLSMYKLITNISNYETK